MNFMKVSCVIAQAQCLTNWADKERLRARLTFETMKQLREKSYRGGEGNFRAAGIFFRYQIPCMDFF